SINLLEYKEKLSELEDVVSMSILLGQFLAKAEAATTVEPLAEFAKQSQQKASESGLKSAEVRRNREWRSIANDLVTSIRLKQPHLSQDDVATEIAALWTKDVPKAPGHKTLKKFVSELERAGLIHRAVKSG